MSEKFEITGDIRSLEGLVPHVTENRDTGNGYYLTSRVYPSGDVEVTAIKLETDDKLKRGGGAKRENKKKSEMTPEVLKKSITRARTMVRRKVKTMNADRMLTLTFRDNVQDINQAWERFHYFIKLMRETFGDTFQYVAVPEYQKRGAVHFHLAIKGYYHANKVRKLWHRAVGRLEGNIDITSPREKIKKSSWNPSRIANYIAKYISKEESTEFNRRRYSSGGKITIPSPLTGWVACGLPIGSLMGDIVAKLTDLPVSQLWETEGYFQITYIST